MLTDAEREVIAHLRNLIANSERITGQAYAVRFPGRIRILLNAVERLDAELRELQPIISDAIGDSCNLTAVEQRTARECVRIVQMDADHLAEDNPQHTPIISLLASNIRDTIARHLLPEEAQC